MARSTSPLFDLPNGVVFEPRSQWSARTIPTAGASGLVPVIRFEFNREHFRNAGRWPIEIRRVAVSAINYFFADNEDLLITNARDATPSIVARSTIRIGVPGRQRYMPNDFNLSALAPMPVAEPQATATNSNNLFGIARLTPDHDRPLIIPRTGSIEMRTTALQGVTTIMGGGPVDLQPNFKSVPTTNAWGEAGGLFGGSGRSVRYDTPIVSYGSSPFLGGNGQDSSSNDDLPYGFAGSLAPGAEAGATNTFWAKNTVFSSKEWNAQESTRNGSTRVRGNTIAFDQMAYDDASTVVPGKLASITQRVGSSVRAINCGSQANWWRPGCPLALSHDSMTPALVYQLPQPIVLQPGDTLNVTATVPGPNYGGQFGFPDQGAAAEYYQIGISFNGYAIISG